MDYSKTPENPGPGPFYAAQVMQEIEARLNFPTAEELNKKYSHNHHINGEGA